MAPGAFGVDTTERVMRREYRTRYNVAMVSLLFAPFALAAQTQEPDPMLLKIGAPGEVQSVIGRIVSTESGNVVSVQEVAKAARGKRWVFLGENHATAAHQNLHAAVIEALVRDGRKVYVGLEMIQRPKQPILDQWSHGDLLRVQFMKDVDWKGQWGYPFTYYDPIFTTCRAFNVPIVGLNVPRDWVRNVGRSGFDGLEASAKQQLPAEMSLSNSYHKQVFGALMGGHPPTGPRGENIYAAQVLWDEGMADTAIKYRVNQPKDDSVFVVIAGSGHVMYRQGINYRIAKRGQGDGITLVMAQSDTVIPVAKGIGDFVFVSRPPKK